MQHNLVDEYALSIHPLILGRQSLRRSSTLRHQDNNHGRDHRNLPNSRTNRGENLSMMTHRHTVHQTYLTLHICN